jgi:hypothetical protein
LSIISLDLYKKERVEGSVYITDFEKYLNQLVWFGGKLNYGTLGEADLSFRF